MLLHHFEAYIKAHPLTPQAVHLLRWQFGLHLRCHYRHFQAQPSRFPGGYFVGHSHRFRFPRAYLPRVTRVTLLRGFPPLFSHERQVPPPQPLVPTLLHGELGVILLRA